jgi:hypothetical protein
MKTSTFLLILFSINLVACLGDEAPDATDNTNPIVVEYIGSVVDDCDKPAPNYKNTLLIHNDCIKIENEIGTLFIELKSSNPNLTGLGLRVHYNSLALSFNTISDIFPKDFIVQGGPVNDNDDDDDDTLTDKYISVNWASVLGDWPGEKTVNSVNKYAETSLFNIKFEVLDINPDNYNINYSISSAPQGISLVLGK